MDDASLRRVARRSRDLIEPLAASVYFAPQVHAAYEKLGFGPGFVAKSGLHYTDLPAYFTSRGACMGEVCGEVVAAAFGVFPEHVVVPSVDAGWKTASRDDILDARLRGQTEALRALFGEEPDGAAKATETLRRMADAGFAGGHHLFAGLRSLDWPDDPIGALFRSADLVREHRGDSHIAAWSAAGLDPIEVCLLSDAWLDQPMKRITRTRGWTDEEMDDALDRLRGRGLLDDDALTDSGRKLRDDIEWQTDLQERSLCEALGDDAEELFRILEPWATAIVGANLYPVTPKKPA